MLHLLREETTHTLLEDRLAPPTADLHTNGPVTATQTLLPAATQTTPAGELDLTAHAPPTEQSAAAAHGDLPAPLTHQ